MSDFERVEIGPCVLYRGDCFTLLPDITADVIATDPPYAQPTHKGARGGAGKSILINFPPLDDARALTFFGLCVESARRWVVTFCDWRHAALAELAGMPVIRCGVWVKKNPMPQITGDRPGTGWEAIMLLHRPGRKQWNGKGRPAVWIEGTTRYGYFGPSLHPAGKPIPLVKSLIEDFSQPGETVLDPMMGSGSTGIACLRTGRKFIGIEIDSAHFATAEGRIRAEWERLQAVGAEAQ